MTAPERSPAPLQSDAPSWPAPPNKAAYFGLAGKFVEIVEPHTEADPTALLIQYLVYAGSVIGRQPHFLAEADRHGTNEFVVLVGESSKGRKGTSRGRVHAVFEQVDEVWSKDRIATGLSTGEGLINHVRDPEEKLLAVREGGTTVDYESTVVDAGVQDKRLLVYEPEFASVLHRIERTGNTLSPVLRSAWDFGTLRVLTKSSPLAATETHISVIGHITRSEVLRYLTRTELANGFANRFLWICTARSKLLPDGGRVPAEALAEHADRLRKVIDWAGEQGVLERDDGARELWHAEYARLSEGQPGMLGAVTARAEAHVMRLATTYALLDQSSMVQIQHLEAALALWDYAERSAQYIFATLSGNPLADRLLQLIRENPEGINRTRIQRALSNHGSRERVDTALLLLKSRGYATSSTEKTGGRPAEHWFPVGTGATEAKEATKGGG